MPILVKARAFTPHPEGQFRVVCVDVLDPFSVESQYGRQDVTQFVFETEHKSESGRPSTVRSGLFNVHGLTPNGKLRKFLSKWRGTPITSQEAGRGIDLEEFLGKSGVATVVHEARGEQVFARTDSVFPTDNPLNSSGNYVRKKDRLKNPQAGESVKADRLEDALDQGRRKKQGRKKSKK